MGNRLSAITTRTGDSGTTGLGDGSRCSKAAPRIEALGDVDELNAHLGLLLCEPVPPAARTLLLQVQQDLFNLGGELAVPGMALLDQAALQRLDEAIASHNAGLPPLREFILPGGSRAAAQAHVCRTVARRAERTLVRLREQQAGGGEGLALALRLLNRLSDLLFVLARVLNEPGAEVYWNHQRDPQRKPAQEPAQEHPREPGAT
jgi:cob(I)alamin adenosyltransferase